MPAFRGEGGGGRMMMTTHGSPRSRRYDGNDGGEDMRHGDAADGVHRGSCMINADACDEMTIILL